MDDELVELAAARRRVQVVVTRALYACCGRAWIERSGYEQTYVGTVREHEGRWMLTAVGIGTISYVVVFDVADVEDVEALVD